MPVSYNSNIPWVTNLTKNIDGVLHIAAAPSVPAGTFLERTDLMGTPHSSAGLDIHPTKPWLVTGGSTMLVARAGITFTRIWTEEEEYFINEARILDFEVEMKALYGASNFNITLLDLPNRTVKYRVEAKNDRAVFTESLHKWELRIAYMHLEYDAGADVACCLKIADDAKDWSWEVRDIQINETVTLPKMGTDCYMLFFTPVEKDGSNLEAFKTYKITSADITVKGVGDIPTRVLRVYK